MRRDEEGWGGMRRDEEGYGRNIRKDWTGFKRKNIPINFFMVYCLKSILIYSISYIIEISWI